MMSSSLPESRFSIARKIAASTSPKPANFSNEIRTMLNELRMMRQEIKEIKEDVSDQKNTLCKMEEEQKNQKEVLSGITENLQKREENRSILQEHVGVMKKEQENQKYVLSGITENLQKIEENRSMLQEHVVVMKKEQENQKDVLKNIMENLEEIGKKQSELQEELSGIKSEQRAQERNFKREFKKEMAGNKTSVEEIKSEQQHQRELLNELKVTVSTDNEEMKERQKSLEASVSKLKCQPTIRDLIFGKWRDVEDYGYYFSAKFEGDIFMEKWYNDSKFTKYTLGVKHSDGWTVSVENNTIVQRTFTDEGEETERRVLHFENDRIIQTIITPGDDASSYIYERIGDPDLE